MALTQASEGGLKISNAGTNGQYLQKQSGNAGGLTWADVPAGVGGATGVDFNDTVKIRLGTGNDLELYHDGHSVIKDSGTAALLIASDETRLLNNGLTENLAKFIANGAVELYYDNSKRIETTAAGVTVDGHLTANNIDVQANILLPDTTATSNGRIRLGAGQDLELFHNGTDSYIQDSGTGNLIIRAAEQIQLKDTDSGEDLAKFIKNGAVELYHNNSKKFETTSAGVQVTGRTWMGDASDSGGSGNAIWIGDGNDLKIFHDGDNSYLQDDGTGFLGIQGSEVRIRNTSGHPQIVCSDDVVELWYDNAKKFETASSGCIVSGDSLKLPDGSAGTPSLTWTDEGNLDTGIFRPGANIMAFSTAGTERVRIDSDGIDVADGNGTTNRTSGSNKGWYVQHGGTTVGRLYQNGTGPEGILELLNDGTQKILVNGDNGTYYGVSTTISALSSERRTKENIISISDSNAWSTLKDIKLYSFSYKNDTNSDTHYGPIVDEIPTDMKVPTSNSDDVGVINTYNSELLLFRAYSTIKQLVAKVETLETKVAALEAA